MNTSDGELLERMRTGDEEAFLSLYRRRQSGVYRFSLQMSGSPTLAEDVTQEVFMTLIGEAENYDAKKGSLQAFLYGIARHFVLRKLEKETRFVALPDDANERPVPAPFLASSDPLGDLTRGETIAAVRQAILILPARYREVVVLCDLHEMSYAEAAMALGCAVGTVRSRLHRARSMLAEKLRGASDEDAATILRAQRSPVL